MSAASLIHGPYAGLTALSHLSDLAQPTTPTVALSQSTWRKFREVADDVEPYRGYDGEPGQTLVEVW